MSHKWELSIDWFRTTGAVDGRLGAVYGTECRRRHRDDRLRHRVPYTAPRRPSTALDAVYGTRVPYTAPSMNAAIQTDTRLFAFFGAKWPHSY
uniref:Uncharacterized protein n=1 Tax=Haemonchus contortus TaxID=6289 RepID=A0A7I4Y518_HAECO